VRRATLAARVRDGELELLDGAGGGTDEVLCVVIGRITNLADPERELALGYAREGEAVVGRCRGEYVVLLWDRAARRGLVARDPLGHRGLFHARRGREVVLGTEVKVVLGMLGARPGPDRVAIAHWIAGTGVPVGRTLYESVERLAPGHLLPLGAGAGASRRHWQPRTAAPSISAPDAAAEALRAAMAASVERALRGVDAPGVMLSGGLDSSSIAALTPTVGAQACCYSTVFPDHPEVDESDNIRATRAHSGLAGVERRFTRGGALAAAAEFLLEHEVPSASSNGFLWRPLLRRAASDGATVVLDGEGGDEMFGCSVMLLADRLRAGRVAGALSLARRIPGMGDDPEARWLARAMSYYGVRGALPPGLHAALRRWRATEVQGDWLRPELRRAHTETHDRWAFKRRPGPRWRSYLLQLLVDHSEALGAHDQFRRESALSGVELRHPFRDPELLDVVLSIDPALAFDPHLSRPVARRAMSELLPDSVRLASRKPNFNPVLSGALAVDGEAVTALLGDPRAEVRAYVRPDVLDAQLAGGLPNVQGRDLLTLWRLVNLELWLRFDDLRGLMEEIVRTAAPSDDRYEVVMVQTAVR
jgi:asparagine synthase (glutamine-hydrolysing)